MNKNVKFTFLVCLLLTLLPICLAESSNNEHCRLTTWESHGSTGKEINLSCEYNGIHYYVEREQHHTLLGYEYQDVIRRIDKDNNDEIIFKLGNGRTLRSIAANETHLYYISVNWLGSEGLFSYNLAEKTKQTIHEGSIPGRIVYCSDALLVYEAYNGLYGYDGSKTFMMLETDEVFTVYEIDNGFAVICDHLHKDDGQFLTSEYLRYYVDKESIAYTNETFEKDVRILFVATDFYLYLLNDRVYYSASTTDEAVEIAIVNNGLGRFDIGAIGDSEFFCIRISDSSSRLSKVLKFEVETLRLINEVVYSGDDTFLAINNHSFRLYDSNYNDKLNHFYYIIV